MDDDHYAGYVRRRLEGVGESLHYMFDDSRKNGGPFVPSDYQHVQLEKISFQVKEARRCLSTISTENDPGNVRREVLSFKKKLGYLDNHVCNLLKPGNDHKFFGQTHGLNPVPWGILRLLICNYKNTVEELLGAYRIKTKDL